MERQNDPILDVLNKDFEELTRGELQLLRNRIRSEIRLDASQPIGHDKLLNGYLVLKRKLCADLETAFFKPVPMKCDFGPPFSAVERFPKVKLPTYDGMNGKCTGRSIMIDGDGITLPILTVFYHIYPFKAVCLTPDGEFVNIESNSINSEIF